MSDQNVETTEPTQTPEQEEMILLKQRAAVLNLKVHHNLSLARLRALVNEAVKKPKTEVADPRVKKTPEQLEFERNDRLRKEATRLIRVKVICMNPNKKEWPGELFDAGNRVIGNVRKYVPLDGRPWHVEQVILNVMEDRKFLHLYTEVDKHGNEVNRSKNEKEFNITILPALTAKELEKMRIEQLNRANAEKV